MIKGLEALVIESYTTARAYGVEDYVLPTMQETFPGIEPLMATAIAHKQQWVADLAGEGVFAALGKDAFGGHLQK